MVYFSSREVAAIAMSAALWGVLNSFFSPMVFSLTRLPILCDLIGFSVLTLAVWWIRKFGAATAIGLIATAINFALNPQAFVFLGFTAAAFVYDAAGTLAGYNNLFTKPRITTLATVGISTMSAVVAGTIIGSFFIAGPVLQQAGGVLGWAGLHTVGGIIGGTIGAILVFALTSRKILKSN